MDVLLGFMPLGQGLNLARDARPQGRELLLLVGQHRLGGRYDIQGLLLVLD